MANFCSTTINKLYNNDVGYDPFNLAVINIVEWTNATNPDGTETNFVLIVRKNIYLLDIKMIAYCLKTFNYEASDAGERNEGRSKKIFLILKMLVYQVLLLKGILLKV